METVKPSEGKRTRTTPMTQSILKSERGGIKKQNREGRAETSAGDQHFTFERLGSVSEHRGAGCSPKQETEAAEDTVARETWDMSLRDEGQRGLVRAPSHTARAGTQGRRKVSGQRRATEDTHFNRGLQLLCLE